MVIKHLSSREGHVVADEEQLKDQKTLNMFEKTQYISMSRSQVTDELFLNTCLALEVNLKRLKWL